MLWQTEQSTNPSHSFRIEIVDGYYWLCRVLKPKVDVNFAYLGGWAHGSKPSAIRGMKVAGEHFVETA
jgi:hypothetical protein